MLGLLPLTQISMVPVRYYSHSKNFQRLFLLPLLTFTQLWPLIVKAQTLLLESCHAGRELTSNDSDNNDVAGACDNAMSSSFLLHDRIRELDSRASALGCEFDRSRCATDQKRAEAFAAGNMWDIGRTMIHT